MTRIALIASSYLPNLGGVEELTRHLALHLQAAGDEVEVWTQSDDDRTLPAREVLDGVTVRRFLFPLPRSQVSSLPPFAKQAFLTLRELRSAVSDFRPELLHVQCFGPNGAYSVALASWTRLPLLVTLQGETVMDDEDAFDVSASLRMALRLGLRRASAVTACSQFTLADASSRFGLATRRGTVIFNGVNLDGTNSGSRTTERPPTFSNVADRYVFALGRMVQKKGFDLLIEAFAGVARQCPGVDLVLAGAGRAEVGLKNLCVQLGLSDRVHLVGRLSREDVAKAMAGAEVFVMPSRLEPFGIVILEAWRAGVPVIATSCGGPPEFVTDGQNGLLVDPLNTPDFTRTIEVALRDHELRHRLSSAGHDAVRTFAWPTIAASYRRIYHDLVPSKPKVRRSASE